MDASRDAVPALRRAGVQPWARRVTPLVLDGGPERCAACDAVLAADQRFCLGCGLRCAPDELRLAALVAAVPEPSLGELGPLATLVAGPPRPIVRSAAVTAVVVLTLGIAIGATIGPAAVPTTAAAQQRPVIVVAAAQPVAAPLAPALPVDGADSSAADEAAADDSSDTSDTSDAQEPVPADTAPPPREPTPHHSTPHAPADPVPPGSTQLAGVVVALDAGGEEVTIVDRAGSLIAIHASGCALQPGDDVHLRARKLANGSWAADRIRRVRSGLTTATVIGVVSWVDTAGGRYALGARGATLLVNAPPPPAASPAPPATTTAVAAPPASTAPPATSASTATAPQPAAATTTAPASATTAASPSALPAVGARVRVALTLTPAHDATPATLVEHKRTPLPPAAVDPPSTAAAPLELAGTIATVDPQAHTLVLALDAADPPTATLKLTLPTAIVANRLVAAERVTVTATPNPDGSYALTGISADGDPVAAEEPSSFQGDQATNAPPTSSDVQLVTSCTLL